MDVLFEIIDEGANFRNKVSFLSIKWCILLCIFLQINTLISAQIDTTIYISTVDVAAKQIKNDGTGSEIQHFDKKDLVTYRTQSLSSLLSEKGNVFIKSYGASSLATISLRGTGSNHTAVLWNGLNLQSSMNGTVDFNLVPVFFMEKIDLQKGGSSARYGSGSIGGSLHLNSFQKPKNGLHGAVGGNLGSFGKQEAFGQLSFAKEKWNSTVKFSDKTVVNDFPLLKNPPNRQTHANLIQIGFTNDNYLKINDKQSLKSYFWYQKTERELPPSRSETTSDAQQNDKSLRAGIDWNRVGESSATKAKVAHLQDELLFFSGVVDSSNSLTKTFILELEQSLFLKNNQVIRFGIQQHRRAAEADGFDGNQLQNRTGIWGSYQRQFLKERLYWTTNLRQELVDGDFIPFTGSTGASFQMNALFNFRVKVSKNYNLPTFNDLFWADGFGQGNPDLKPEEGWSGEAGFDVEKKLNNWHFKSGMTAFNSIIENWILWQPTGSTWQPQNKREVHSRGIETAIFIKYTRNDWQFSTNANYAYTKSTIEKINDGDNPRQLGKQLLYVPRNTANLSLKMARKSTFLTYQHQYVGKRETTRDNNADEAADAYDTAQLLLGHTLQFRKKNASIQLTINNLWNEDYEVLAFRPMPGRSFEVMGMFEF
ncbi:MAG: vitamin B12 transporter [Paraglaciecola sp.]|jgi:vitamin B12 transporter